MIGLVVVLGSAFAVEARVVLERVGTFRINKSSGRIDQLIRLPDGGYVVRDSNYRDENAQAVEIYDSDGRFRNKIGRFGKGAGQYYRLKTVAVGQDGTIWVADIANRLTLFASDGRVIATRLIQKPGFQVFGLSLDEQNGVFYLAGCLPNKVYLDLGCKLVHQYAISSRSYGRSYLDTDPEAIHKKLLSLEDYHVDTDGRGVVWAADGPIHKAFRIEPGSGRVQSFPFVSRVATRVPALTPGPNMDINPIYEAAFLIERVLVTGSHVVVSIGQQKTSRYVLQVLGPNGRQLAVDLDSPGRLVGKTSAGNLYFARGYDITEYRIR
jgi:hypothetical protein